MIAAGFRIGYAQNEGFRLNDLEYFENQGVNVMAFQDIYPEGHQGGIAIIMHGTRIATNGDLRLDITPGQWQPIPKQIKRIVDRSAGTITTYLSYPDSSRNRKGYNPIIYPDLYLTYKVRTTSVGGSIRVTVDLDKPLPQEFEGKVGFNMELFPGILFGKTWIMDQVQGIFPRQPYGPGMETGSGTTEAAMPMAEGKMLVIAPEEDKLRLSFKSLTGNIQLIDGRYIHNNGWFVLRSVVPAGKTTGAVEWVITPNVIEGWLSSPVVHVSQIGYHNAQPKISLIELDRSDKRREKASLLKINPDGSKSVVLSEMPREWGTFLRYNYLEFNFSSARETGLYEIKYGDVNSQPFRIAADVFKRGVWQPTIEYFLPVQMCHMRVNEKYRVWHGLCHMDDARMAPVNHNHFDGYFQGPSTLTRYKPGDRVPGLNSGGWHDAGDYDIRLESQTGEIYILTQIYEEFGIKYDETSIDQVNKVVEIHQPDGKPDILQQIEHGVLSVIGGYKSLGRFYRGIICPALRQYVLLGDGVNMTDGLFYSSLLKPGEKTATESSLTDDRWVFTREDPASDLSSAAHLAAASRVLKGFNDSLSVQCLDISEAVFRSRTQSTMMLPASALHAASELFLTTGKKEYSDFLIAHKQQVIDGFRYNGWLTCRALFKMKNEDLIEAVKEVASSFARDIENDGAKTPFGVPYRPNIWGAGWDIQSFGVRQYFLHKYFPEFFREDYIFNSLNFILGVHPGSNTESFASGVGVRSSTVAYGVNRADWSYIPGGVSSGTALIRPDFPELLDWPYLWQQQEYVMGGGATNFVFLVLAADTFFNQ